jgi:hypothetical protein
MAPLTLRYFLSYSDAVANVNEQQTNGTSLYTIGNNCPPDVEIAVGGAAFVQTVSTTSGWLIYWAGAPPSGASVGGPYFKGNILNTLPLITPLYTLYPAPSPCFLEGSKILCQVDGKEEYYPIESLRTGTLVKTSLDGFKPIVYIGHSKIYNPPNQLRSTNRLYRCSTTKYPELEEDLIITGYHSILVDDITDKQRKEMLEQMKDIYVTSRKYRLIASVDERAEPYEIEGTFPIWHLALEHDNYYMNYGIYANGLLVESTSKRYMKELSGMTLV